MKSSKIHQRFSERLKSSDVLTNPEKYLGPNWEDVLNFWIYVDTLSDPEKEKMNDRYWALDDAVRVAAIDAAWDAADDVVGADFRYEASLAVYDVTRLHVFARATVELIGSHKLLEQNKILTFLPLSLKKQFIISKNS